MIRMMLAAAIAVGATAMAAPDNPQWMKLSDALNASARDGRPIAVFVAVNPNGSS